MSANTSKEPYFCKGCGQVVRIVRDEGSGKVGAQCACPESIPVWIAHPLPSEWSA